nr:MAG TPA: hypothetical protein [Caudoviricetes sp.]
MLCFCLFFISIYRDSRIASRQTLIHLHRFF